jgi:F-type H+-transporting ATPase subunit b
MAEQTAKTVASTQQAPAGEHGKFPPFDAQTFPSQLFWLIVVFVALYLLMSRMALPRIASILEERRKHIDDHLAEAQRLKGKSEAAIAAHEAAIAEAHIRAQTLASDARAKATADAEARRKDLDIKLGQRIADAEKDISAARSAAMTKVHGIAEETTRALVERLIGVTPSAQDVSQAVKDALKR